MPPRSIPSPSSVTADKENSSTPPHGSATGTGRRSSFLELNKQSDISIPQIKVSLEDITYMPVTASSSVGSSYSRHRKDREDRTVVLDRISTQINPFELTAWMGPSGSGKTSLASVVANLVEDPSDICSGTIRVNNEEGRIPKQMVGVVWQDDLLLSNLTVEETIYFAARLKTPSSVSDQEVRKLVEETMIELGLLHVRNNPIGSATESGHGSSRISGGERKRVSLAQEIVVRPSLLVCDEPTSGLDATTAHSLVKTLKDLASLGHSIALVIHQPRTDIFNMLDRLLLLSKGRVVYEGNPKTVRTYLECFVDPLPPETGIADWIMDTVIADERRQKSLCIDGNKKSSTASDDGQYVSLADRWAANRSKFEQTTKQAECNDNKKEPMTPSGDHRHENHRRIFSLAQFRKNKQKSMYEASFGRELSMLTKRISKQRRGEKITRVSFLLTLTYVIFTSFMYFRLPDDTANIFERNSLLFFLLIAQGMGIVNTSIVVFNRERALLRRERAKKLYRVLPFFLAKAASDMTNNILLPLLYGIITYWLAGLRPSFVAFLKFLLCYYLTLSCAQSMGFFLSILYPNMAIAMILAPPITLFMFISAGFYAPISNMHIALKWVSTVSFARYGYSGLLINEFGGREIPCYESSGEEDGDDGTDFKGITVGGGECPLPGEEVYESIGINGVFASYWFNLGIVAIFQTVFLVGAYALLRRSK